jgi:VWFA-related protein
LVSVLDANGLSIPNLAPDNLQLSEDGRPPVKPTSLQSTTNPEAPIAICLAIDVSGSMVGQPLQDAKSAAKTFVDSLGSQDQACVIAFSDQVNLDTGAFNPAKEANLTSDKNLLKNLIDTLQADTKPGTPLYDAALKSIKIVAMQPPGTRAVILFTDGKDEKLDQATNQAGPGSISTAERPIAAAKEAHIPVFTIGLGKEIDSRYLQRIAEETGGRYQETPASDKLTETFQNIGVQLKTQYLVKFKSQAFPDGKDHNLRVRAKTAAGEAENGFTYGLDPKVVLTKPFVKLYYKEGDDRKDLIDEQKLKGTVTIAPQIATGSIISYTVFVVDNTAIFTATVAPFTFAWDTMQHQPGIHTLTVRAVDDKNQMNDERAVRVEIVPTNFFEELPLAVKIGATAAVLIVMLLAIVFVARRTRPMQKLCPRGLHVMPPGATVCLFCQQGVATQGAPTPYVNVPFESTAPPGTPQPVLPGEGFPPEGGAPGAKTEVIGGVGDGVASVPPALPTIQLKRQPTTLSFLVMQSGDHPSKEFTLHAGETSIGRAGTNDIIVDDPTVSRQQAKIRHEEQTYYLYDLASTNPTLVNGKVVKGRRKLVENDKIQMGGVVFIFKQVSGVG